MKLFRIENIKIAPLLVTARTHDDAENVLAHAFVMGMANKPDAEFDIVPWMLEVTSWPDALKLWLDQDRRGIVWSIEDDNSVELVSTRLSDLKCSEN